jgi:septum formation protein
MSRPLILASTSSIRLQLLRNAGLDVSAQPARVDEDSIRQSLEADGATPRDIADALAEMKAARIADRRPGSLVLGCDQVLDFKGTAFAKPTSQDHARTQLLSLRGQTHSLLSAAVLYDDGQPIWRHVGQARLTMRAFSEDYLDEYLARNWPQIGHSVGAYMLEAEGIRLFDRIEGDYFTILGLPLLPLLSYLATRGFIPA